MSGRLEIKLYMFSLQAQSRLVYLVSATNRHIPLALFSNLVGDETKKAIATTLLKYPKNRFYE